MKPSGLMNPGFVNVTAHNMIVEKISIKVKGEIEDSAQQEIFWGTLVYVVSSCTSTNSVSPLCVTFC